MSHLKSAVRPGVGASITIVLLALAAGSWWVTVELAGTMSGSGMAMPMLSLGPFLLAWAVMMAAMMLPAIAPVVRLYNHAAAAGRVAPTGYFVLGYLVVWALSGLPAFLLWQAMAMPLMEGETWALSAAGGTLLAAGIYQVLPLKRACLRHCRSPMSYFMRQKRPLDRPSGAARAGAIHGTYCFGCCVALMVVLVGVAAMQPWWAAVLAVVIYVERNGRMGEAFSLAVAAALIALGGAAVIEPSLVSSLI